MHNFVRGVLRFLANISQWIVAAFLGLIVVGSAIGAFEKRAVGLDTTAYFVAVGAMGVAAAVLLPPVFFRLPIKGRLASYGFALMGLVALAWAFGTVQAAYEKTPQGAEEAKAAAAKAATEAAFERAEAERARQDVQRQTAVAFVEEQERVQEREAADLQRKIERCINWQGQIPALAREVKGTLHNPRSFEHVRTEVRTVGGEPAAVMVYRAENGFSAIRTEAVSATVMDDCSVIAVETYDPE